MRFKELKQIILKYNLKEYFNISLHITLFDEDYSRFYIVKRKLLERLVSKESKLKYIVFRNVDYSMRGAISDVKYFKDKDTATEYIWSLFKAYVVNMTVDVVEVTDSILQKKNALLEIIKLVEETVN